MLRHNFYLLLIIIFLFQVTLAPARAQISVLPKPLTGTFIFPDFEIKTDAELNQYLDEVKALGMDTLVWAYSGTVIYKADCSGVERTENFFTQNSANYLLNAERLLTGIHQKGLSVYLGLAGIYRCDSQFWSSNPTDPNSYAGRTIAQSKALISNLDQLCQQKGWTCDGSSFIKGFYISQESPVGSLIQNANFYRTLNQEIKALKPNMKLIVSPYLLNSESYQTVYNNIYYAVGNLGFDIIAPQDGVGAGNTTTFVSSRQHYQALSDAVKKGNTDYGKQVASWANLETFLPWINQQLPWPPSNLKTLSWQLRASDDLTDKKITWVHTWGFSTIPPLNNYGSQYPAYLVSQRQAFKNDYLNKPIITAAFTWYTPVNFVVKGYNFGSNGQAVNFYLHYGGKSFNQSLIINPTAQDLVEIHLPLASIPSFNPANQFELAIQNSAGEVGYYVSQTPETAATPSFPEIIPFTPTQEPIPTNPPIIDGDLDGNGFRDILDFMIVIKQFNPLSSLGIFDFNQLLSYFNQS